MTAAYNEPTPRTGRVADAVVLAHWLASEGGTSRQPLREPLLPEGRRPRARVFWLGAVVVAAAHQAVEPLGRER